MYRSSFLSLLAGGLFVSSVAGCVAAPGAKVPVAGAAKPAGSVTAGTAKPAAGTLAGQVLMPSHLVGAANVIAAGGGNVIAAGGGNVIAAGGGNYRLLASEAELPVMGATVVLRDAVTRQRLAWAKPTKTDAQGRYSFPNLPRQANVLVEVLFATKDQQPYRLLDLASADPKASNRVTWSSTAVVASTLKKSAQLGAGALRKLYVLDLAELDKAQREIETALGQMAEADRESKLENLVEAEAAEVRDGEVVLADGLAEETLADAQDLVVALEALDAELAAAFDQIEAEVNAALDAAEAELTAQLEDMFAHSGFDAPDGSEDDGASDDHGSEADSE